MNTPTPRTDKLEGNLIEFCDNQIRFSKMTDHAKTLERELTAVTYQRDELLRYNEAFRKETLICADCDSISKEEYDQAIEQRDRLQKIVDEQCRVSSVCREYRDQRDRLAEALKRIVTIYENPEKGCIPSSSDMYDEALQSLTPNKL